LRVPSRETRFSVGSVVCRTRTVVCVAKGGGFSKKTKAKSKVDKSKNSQFIEGKQGKEDQMITQYKEAMAKKENVSAQAIDEEDFAAKLAALKSKKTPLTNAKASTGGQRSKNTWTGVSTGPSRSVLEGGLEAAESKEAEETDGSRLPFQIGAVLAVIAFIFVSAGSDLQNLTGGLRSKQSQASRDLDPEMKARFKMQAAKFEETLAINPDDAEAVEGAAVLYAQLGEFKQADGYLERLVLLKPNDVESARLLAETKAQEGDYSAAATKYVAALKISPDNLELLRGYISVLSADKKQSEAVAALNEVRPRAQARGNQGLEGSGAEPVDILQLELLLGKVYGEWEGHTSDAVAVYNRMIQDYAGDFRGYLAKGSLLKQIGKTKDAERMFLQARYLAPDAARSLVDQVASRATTADYSQNFFDIGGYRRL